MSTDKYAIFLDFDGTLSHDNTVSKENIEAIKKVQKLGHYVFVSTGRNRPGIEPVASRFHNFDGYISGLGSHISFNGETLFSKYFTMDEMSHIIGNFENEDIDLMVGCIEGNYVVNATDVYNENFIRVASAEEFERVCSTCHMQKLESRFVGWTDEQKAILDSVSTAFFHGHYTECCPKGCSKSNAIKIVCDKLCVKQENTIAMGDSTNDLDMILASGIGVVMGNADDFMKAQADFVTKDCREHGVAYALEKLILGKED